MRVAGDHEQSDQRAVTMEYHRRRVMGKQRASFLVKIASAPATVFVVALGVRFALLNQFFPTTIWPFFYKNNEVSRIAWALVSGWGFSSPWPNTPLAPTAQQPPLYPLLLAGIFKLAGAYTYRSLWIAVVLNAIFSAVAAAMMVRLGRRDLSPAAGLLAGWVCACWGYEGVVSLRLWDSSLVGLMIVLVLWWTPALEESGSMATWSLFGAVTGAALLTDTGLASILLPLWVWLWWRRRGRGQSRYLIPVSVAVCVVVLAPWTIRNYQVFHRFIPVRDNFGMEFWIGNHEGAPIHAVNFPRDFPLNHAEAYSREGEINFMESRQRLALEFIRSHPVRFLLMCGDRAVGYWTQPYPVIWGAVAVACWTGLVLLFRQRARMAFPYAMVIGLFPLVFYATHAFLTYRQPIEPEILLLASYALIGGVKALAGGRRSRGLAAH